MKRILSILFSTKLTAILFLSFAISMALGTFIESKYGTPASRILVYNAKWFEAIMLLFVINFIGNIKRYRLFRKEKWAILLLHLSFILIILGAAITRYIGYEGMMPIREGSTADSFLSQEAYLTVLIDGEYEGQALRKTLQRPLRLSEYTTNDFELHDNFKGRKVSILYKNYYLYAKEGIALNTLGERYLKIVESNGDSRHDHFIKSGEIENIHNVLIGHNTNQQGVINIDTSLDVYRIHSPFEGNYMRMSDRKTGVLRKGVRDTLHLRSLYTISGLKFVFPELVVRGEKGVVRAKRNDPVSEEALVLDLTVDGDTREVFLLGGKSRSTVYKDVEMKDLTLHLGFGSKSYKLPFSITLRDFIAEKYPGTEKSYASFKSEVTVNDSQNFDYAIYMNHVLDYKGYRFFQASFDRDEKGTVLSVNHDSLGTWVSYTGYFLLYLGLISFMFFGKTRFVSLSKNLRDFKTSKTFVIFIICLLGIQIGWSQNQYYEAISQSQIDSIIKVSAPSKRQASDFGKLIVQDNGRMKPINTLSSELIRKVSKRESYNGLNSDQVLLSMTRNSRIWYYAKFIYLKRGNDSIRKLIGISKDERYARMIDFFDERGAYKLSPYLRESYATATPNQFQKDYKETDRRLGLLNQALTHYLLRLFPLPNDPNYKWINAEELQEKKNFITDTLYANFIKNIIPFYLISLEKGDKESLGRASNLLKAIRKNQQNYASDILPSDKKIKAEILYNEYDVFRKLFLYYMCFGSLLMIILVVRIFRDNKTFCVLSRILKYVIFCLFGLHTLGLISRWYISGHAPWSDAYESIIYIAWASMGMGVIFSRKSLLTLSSTTFVTSMILMVAHWNWLDPNIANLQPVLNSYWLMIHVAIIVASYGPFTLGMILGLVNMMLMLFLRKSNKDRVMRPIKELTIVCELSLTVGLVMLAIGNFLGGQWANESWGRYWGWDPKETWALISIMVYAFVIHMRFVPKLRGLFTFNLLAVLAYGSIMMTYFGVNFYLTGLHSYASGDVIVTPSFVYYILIFVFMLSIWSYMKYRNVYKGKD